MWYILTVKLLFVSWKIWLFVQVLGFLNSACNPFVYGIFSKNFRNGFKEAFFGLRKSGKSRRSTLKSDVYTITAVKGRTQERTAQSTSTTTGSNSVNLCPTKESVV